jgi:membrane associated rhomboid family serine protease
VNRALRNQFVQILVVLGVILAVHVVNIAGSMWLTPYGVIPRTFIGLRGILFSPLLHGDWTHLFANLPPLGVMLGLLAFVRGKYLWRIAGTIWVMSGIAVWLVGRPGSVQVGASGWIYGLAAYLVMYAWIQRDWRSALAAVTVVFLYGGIVWGLLPTQPGVSWEGHLAGAVAGMMIAAPGGSARRSSR